LADRFCRNCGRELAEDDRFCPNCGQDQTATFPPEQYIQTPNVNVPPPQSSPARAGFGAGFGAAIGWILGGCLVLVVVTMLMFGGCAALLAGSSG
jgi:hypothetical protein